MECETARRMHKPPHGGKWRTFRNAEGNSRALVEMSSAASGSEHKTEAFAAEEKRGSVDELDEELEGPCVVEVDADRFYEAVADVFDLHPASFLKLIDAMAKYEVAFPPSVQQIVEDRAGDYRAVSYYDLVAMTCGGCDGIPCREIAAAVLAFLFGDTDPVFGEYPCDYDSDTERARLAHVEHVRTVYRDAEAYLCHVESRLGRALSQREDRKHLVRARLAHFVK